VILVPEFPRDQPANGSGRRPRGPVGVVLAGAGARGAFEAGYFATLLRADPPLLDGDLRPRIYVGTSVGAINAVLFASLAHLPPGEMAGEALRRWRTITMDMVLRPAFRSLPVAIAQYNAGLVGLGDGPVALFDISPLAASLSNPALIDWDQLHDNVRQGVVDVVAAVTSEFGSGRTKVFYDAVKPELQRLDSDPNQAIDYVNTALGAKHVQASAAIPLAFSPVQLGPKEAATWHMDGGVRLNAPLKPALTFGANSLIVIATDPSRYGTSAEADRRTTAPTMQEAALQVMRGVLTDRMVQDVRDLLRTNDLILAGGDRIDQSKYTCVPVIFGGPGASEDVGGVAARALPEILHGVRALQHLDTALLQFILSSNLDSRPNLMSYLLFEPEFIDGAISLGVQYAMNLLVERPKDPWRWRPPS
jgi:NTE family protein